MTLRVDETVSCAICHPLENFGMDSSPVPVGVKGQLGKRNAPSVYNSRYNFVQYAKFDRHLRGEESALNEKDKDFFKVPSLRNVAMTAPYFHDGETKTLREALTKMTAFQLGRIVKDDDIDDIVTFLKTLTGEPQYEK